ncbi:cob(I)yrinic acid a,c-diamide adenosyltransferase [Shimazuella sp. AN120528]|uniref:cob(I)yrinic acid a,c-diamide adenosyltransferase n=1 Tax=Shimazuella soli TaxID=1892854 RepID=UPI001F0F96E6|nr:cob(I)yrinic acid a,c-diamide adenosyltransferase [Shimazuella soli]MCH5583368.1 cob(I)yrinic acid a,c-diamide adenosyltransferase [Shimazuella soli]
MKIYTRTGDQGETGLIGERRRKDNLRVEAYGTVDELNAFIGEAIVRLQEDIYTDMRKNLTIIQHQLFDAGGDLAQVGKNRTYLVKAKMVDDLEYLIDQYDKECSELANFIVPGGTAQSTAFHLCRVVARRAERRVVTLCSTEETNEEIRRYLNRLSDFFFVLARVANVRAGQTDIPYKRNQELR